MEDFVDSFKKAQIKNMKRKNEDSEETEEVKKMKESDLNVYHEIQEKLSETGNELNSELEKAKQKYYISYFKKAVEKLPITSDIIDINNIGEGYEGFLKTYSIAKTCVNADLQFKKIVAFNSIYDMITNVAGKFIHDRVIVPNMSSMVESDILNNAFKIYQKELTSQDDSSQLHCISYLIQDEIEKKEISKIPNPIYNRFTQQMSAVSKYISEILRSLALK